MRTFTDAYNDPDGEVFRSIQRRYESQGCALPSFVVRHRAMAGDELSRLKPTEFALPAKRLFPVCSKAETWKSIAYFNVLKTAALTPASAQEREETRGLLAKAASLWGLDDDEVKSLVHDVTLALPKKAEAEPDVRADTFLKKAPALSMEERREQAGLILRAASAEALDGDTLRALQKHAGAATCTAGEAVRALEAVITEIPYLSDYRKPFIALQDSLRRTASAELLDPADVSEMVGLLEQAERQYRLKTASAEKLRTFVMSDALASVDGRLDETSLPGGIIAKRASVEANAERIGTYLSNRHGIDVYGPEAVLAALKGMAPVDIVPLRPLIGG